MFPEGTEDPNAEPEPEADGLASADDGPGAAGFGDAFLSPALEVPTPNEPAAELEAGNGFLNMPVPGAFRFLLVPVVD